jgi:3-hydroxybutyryl-CoA dehydrogenase
MGGGIAQVCAQCGLPVYLYDIAPQMLDRALKNIGSSVSKFVEKGKLTESTDKIMGRITTSTDLGGVAGSDLIIEAVFENIEVKSNVLKQLDAVVGKETIIASNTSAIPISKLGKFISSPERFLGMHFFSPVPMMNVVEVVKGICTSDATFKFGGDFVRFIGKEPIMVHRDIAGFVLNRINMLANMEAARLVEQGVATAEDIDKGVRLAFGRKMGPLETNDMAGLDVALSAYMNTYEEERDNKFYPPSILRQKVAAGHLGRKTGRGWYEYNPDGTKKQL